MANNVSIMTPTPYSLILSCCRSSCFIASHLLPRHNTYCSIVTLLLPKLSA
ncbi:hypothetical protein HanRHA438_Chr09g0416501 [Helianthus annuus]|nr:hypothetical protein HanRHA438_Chr09g0416501 [Helianthus annuus]